MASGSPAIDRMKAGRGLGRVFWSLACSQRLPCGEETMEGSGDAPEAPAQPSWPTVLTFLQQEYRRFEVERSEHALEVSSLKVRARPPRCHCRIAPVG